MWISVLVVAGLGIVFASFLTYFFVKFHVEENPLVSQIYQLLPHANCGACGFAGCSGFAEALSEGKVPPEKCAMITPENLKKICSLLGIEGGEKERKVARVFCFGGINAKRRVEYNTIKSCSAVKAFFTTNYECAYGCIGFGDCIEVCPVKAIKMGEKGIPEIDENICVGCGKCVEICPQNIIHLVPFDKKVYIACSSHDKGGKVIKICKSGCIGCGKCVKVCPQEAIKLENNLAVIDYDKCDNCEKCVSECPRKIIFVSERKVEMVA